MSLLLLLTGEPETFAARGVVRPVRVRRAVAPRLSPILHVGPPAATAAPITGTGSALFGLTVSSTAAFDNGGGLTSRGVQRPVRPSRVDPRTNRIGAPQVLARTTQDVAASGTVLFGLTVTADGAVGSGVSGAATALFGLTVTGSSAVLPPPITATGTARFGLTVSSTGTHTPPPITGTATVAFGLTVSGAASFTIPAITGTGTVRFGLTVTGVATVPITRAPLRVVDSSTARITVADATRPRLAITDQSTARLTVRDDSFLPGGAP